VLCKQDLEEPCGLEHDNVGAWFPSRVIQCETWSPALPETVFHGCFRRVLPGREPSDIRPEADVIESPPAALLDPSLGGSVSKAVRYLRCVLDGRIGPLDVKGLGLIQFPVEILDVSALRAVDASDNQIRDLPDDLNRLTNLSRLNLGHNLLELLPPGVRFLTALTYLSVACNRLAEVCPELGACGRLKELDLSNNKLVTLPHTIGNCIQLKNVQIQGNYIQVLPPSMSLASSMVSLKLDSDPAHNRFSSPPNPIPSQSTFNLLRYLREIYTYENERRLYMPGYDLDYVPDLVLEAATSVTALNLDGNCISTIPEAISQFTLLQELLSVCDNAIGSVPVSIGTLTRLNALRLSGNHLEAIPGEFSTLVNLRVLALDHNRLQEIPEPLAALTRLEEFTFADNLVKFFYPGFGLISSISTLALENNPLLVPGPDIKDRTTPEVPCISPYSLICLLQKLTHRLNPGRFWGILAS
jgi:leucine-rich repeat protein SHOC2